MKQNADSLLFGILFALVLVSIGLSAHSMVRSAQSWPQPPARTELLRPAAPPIVTPSGLAGTPAPAVRARAGRSV